MGKKNESSFFNFNSGQLMSKKEHELLTKACEFQKKYFQDFNNGIMSGDPIWSADSLLSRKFIIEKESGYVIRHKFNDKIVKIIVPSEFIEDDNFIEHALLHEMIHAYEAILLERPMHYHYVIAKLYERILSKIPNLMEIIELNIGRYKSEHTIFFLLKSLDLDLKLKFSIGSVYEHGHHIKLELPKHSFF